MKVQDAEHLFHNFTFEKSSKDIVAAATRKRDTVLTKIHEREERLAKIRNEYKITDAALIDIMRQARQQTASNAVSYSFSNGVPSSVPSRDGRGLTEETITIGAGVVNNLLTEQDFIEGEREQIKRLELVIRNLADLPTGFEGAIRGHRLSYVELEFLGF